MKLAKKLFSTLLAAAVLSSAAAMTAAAKPDSGLSIFPLENNENDLGYWETQMADNEYAPLNSEGCWVKTTLGDDGSLTMEKTDKSGNDFPRIRTLLQEDLPYIDMEKNPYLYFDFTAENCSWMIQFNHGQVTVKLAKGIVEATGQGELVGGDNVVAMDKDGPAGHYQGKLDLTKYYSDEEVIGLAGQKKLNAPSVAIYIVSPKNGGKLTINNLSIGNDDDSQASGPKLNLLLKNGEAGGDEPEETTDATESTTTAAKTTKTTTTTAGKTTTTAAGSDNGDSNMWIYIVIAVAVVVIAGVVVAVVMVKKKKGDGVPPIGSDKPDDTDKK